MLKSLSISNYALISHLKIDFDAGMSVLTGETGAGKSIIIGALSLIQGQRADTKVIKEGTLKSIVEANFEIKNYNLQTFFSDNELDYNDNLLIRREITSTGKSRAFVNDTPVSLNVLRDLSNRLLDIHSQHENLLLSTENYQLQVVDTIAKNQTELIAFQTAFNQWNIAKTELLKLRKEAERQNADMDYLLFQFKQLEEANLKEGEQNELETELEVLSHVEEIKTELQHADFLLSSDEQNIVKSVREVANAIQKIKSYVPDGDNWTERFESILIDLKDISSDISTVQENTDFNPERLSFVDSRLSLLYSLQKKFKTESVEDLIQLRESFRTQLTRIDNFEDELNAAKMHLDDACEAMKISATVLTKSREKAKPVIEKYLMEQLFLLGMENVRFVVNIKAGDEFTEKGNDIVEFLFSANKNRSVQSVAEIASGGEISRLMLAIKSLLIRKSDLPTIIFDEIDTGVSGEIAGRMGEIMKKMSESTQVITITHLPQIAAKGNVHYRVYKDNSGIQTETFIQRLNSEERILELAQILSGKKITEAALMNAKELMQN